MAMMTRESYMIMKLHQNLFKDLPETVQQTEEIQRARSVILSRLETLDYVTIKCMFILMRRKRRVL